MASVTGASLLNDKFDALSQRFDLLKTVPKEQAQLINASISDWQDWYWGNLDNWPADELMHWQDVYVKTARLLDEVASHTVMVSDVTQTDDYRPPTGKVIHLPPLLVTARPPPAPPPYVAPPPVLYEERPLAPVSPRSQVQLTPMGTVDVSGWSNMELPTLVRANLPESHPWSPDFTERPNAKGGLIALVLAIGFGTVAKRQGWL